MQPEQESPREFVDEVLQAFAFLESAGFEFESAKLLDTYLSGELVILASPSVVLEIELDHRGAVDAVLSLRADLFRQWHLAQFAPVMLGSGAVTEPVERPLARPPFAFSGDTTREHALELLATFAREHAMRALEGDLAAFRNASRRP